MGRLINNDSQKIPFFGPVLNKSHGVCFLIALFGIGGEDYG
jgi:hypothetical protein